MSIFTQMKQSLFLLLLAATTAQAQQHTEAFHFKSPATVVSNSLYDSIHLIDMRDDTTNLGIVQKGAFNRKAKVVAEVALNIQVASLLKSMIDSTAKQGELQLLLKEMSFSEITTFSERGFYFLKADLYSKKEAGYALLDRIDTVVMVKSIDVTKATLRSGSKNFTEFILSNLNKEPIADTYYSYYELTRMDSIEKSRLLLYTADKLRECVYENYLNFMNQEPNRFLFQVKEKKGVLSEISILNKNNKYEKIALKNTYAVVYKGQPYVATDYGYYKLLKKDNDYYFTGKYKTAASTGSLITAGFFFGILGAAIAADAGGSEVGEMKLDHATGSFKVVSPKIKNRGTSASH